MQISKFKIVLPGLTKKSLTFNLPIYDSKEKTLSNLLLNFFNKLTNYIYFVFLFLLPFSYVLLSNNNEDSVLKFITLFICLLLALLIIILILGKSKRFIDPNGFILVLVFALLTSISAVLISNYPGFTSFGLTGFRIISSFFCLLNIGIFYFTCLNVTTIKKFEFSINTLTLSFILYSLHIYTQLSNVNSSLNLLILLITDMLLVLSILYFYNYRLIKILIFCLISELILSNYNLFINKDNNILLLLSIALSIFIISTINIVIKKEYYINKINFLLNNFKSLSNISTSEELTSDKLYFLTYLITPLLSLLYVIYIAVNNNFLSYLKIQFNTIYSLILNLQLSNNNASPIVKTLTGLGWSHYNPIYSLVENIISISGLFGLVTYLLIWCFAIYKSINLFIQLNNSKKDNRLISILIVINMLILPLSLTNLSALYLLIWWISFSLICSYYTFTLNTWDESHEKQLNLFLSRFNNIKINNSYINKVIILFKYLAILLIIILFLIIIYNIFNYIDISKLS